MSDPGVFQFNPLPLTILREHGSSLISNAILHLSVKHIKQWQTSDADPISLGLSRTPPSLTKIWTIFTAMSRGGAKQSTASRVTRYLMVSRRHWAANADLTLGHNRILARHRPGCVKMARRGIA